MTVAAQQTNRASHATPSDARQAIGTQCYDVTKLDFSNLTISTPGRTFVFHNGTAIEGPAVEAGPNSQPDWKAEIQRDTIVRPAPGTAVRFLLIHDEHETGSGWRFYLVGFICSGGELKEVFHRDALSLSIDRMDATAIVVTESVKRGEPGKKCWFYAWDADRSRYVLSSVWSTQ